MSKTSFSSWKLVLELCSLNHTSWAVQDPHWTRMLISQMARCQNCTWHIILFNDCIFTAHKLSLRRLCFYRCLSVHEGSTWAGTPPGRYPLREVPPGRYPSGRYPPGRCPQAGTPQQVHSLGMYTSLGRYTPLGRYNPPGRYTSPWQVHPQVGTPSQAGTPLPRVGTHPLGYSACWGTVNKRAVRIPLECILVKI